MVLRTPVARAFCFCCLFFFILVDNVYCAINDIEHDILQDFYDSTVQSPTIPTANLNGFQESVDKENDGFSRRHVLQRRSQSPAEGETSCSLSEDNVSRFYRQSSRQWLVTDEVLDTIDYDVQLIIECANEDDGIFFRTSTVVRPLRTLNVTKNLTLGTQYEPDFAGNGSQISTPEMTRFTCPESGQVITSQSPSFTLRDLVIEDCNSTSSIIELDTECDQQGSVGTVRLLRIFIENNAVSGETHIIDSRPLSCLHLELDDVLMRQNLCATGSCVLLSAKNTLRNIQLFRNKGVNDSSSKSAIFSASKDSNTTAINVTSEGNQIRSFSVSNGSLIIVDSNFSDNKWNLSSLTLTRDNSTGGGVLFSNHSSVYISRTIFKENYAINGGGIFALSSNVSISDCQFLENDAGEGNGGALYGNYNSSFDISASVFIRNHAYRGAGLHSNYTTRISILDSRFLGNNCSRSCGIDIDYGIASIRSSKFIHNKAVKRGAALCIYSTNLTIENSTFIKNNASSGGACYFLFNSQIIGDDLVFDNNIAHGGSGGGVYLYNRSQLNITNSTFLRNRASTNGGAFFAYIQTTMSLRGVQFRNNTCISRGGVISIMRNSRFWIFQSFLSKNEATNGGSISIIAGSNATISDCNFTNNVARNFGGVIYSERGATLSLSSSTVHNNEAGHGGCLYLYGINNGSISNSFFSNNVAESNGGAISLAFSSSFVTSNSSFLGNVAWRGGVIFVYNSFLTIHATTLESNHATFGAAIYSWNVTMNIADSSFMANHVNGSGGAMLIRQSNATLGNIIVQYNKAMEECGGICAIHWSHLIARNVSIIFNSAKMRGGGIGIANASSILCDLCTVKNNKSYRGAGLYAISNHSIPIVAQLQNSRFENNSAQAYGGGMVFVALADRSISCSNTSGNCGYAILLNTSFIGNYANHSGAIILTTHASRVLIDCDYKGKSLAFLSTNDFKSLMTLNPKQLCPSWIGNRVHPKAHGDIIGTYGQVSVLTIGHDEEVRLVGNTKKGYVLNNVSSGKRLPIIYVKIMDEFGVGPAPTLPNLFEARLSSRDGFIHREYPANFLAGSGNFSEVIGFDLPGNYTLEIKFNNPALETVTLTVIVRECNIGEELIDNELVCQKCDAVSYNFNPNQIRGCTQCPYGGDCSGKYIIPKKGYWHKSPCHSKVQKCLVEEACSIENRQEALMKFSDNYVNCIANTTTLIAYNGIVCHEGYKGLLCGSCNGSFGLSARFLCSSCSNRILSLLTIFAIAIYLLGVAAFTIRGCLPFTLNTHDYSSSSDQLSHDAGPSTRDSQVNIEMVKMLVEGYIEHEDSEEAQLPTASRSQMPTTQQDNEYELTRWRTTEIFKIMINFLQTTAIAANVNVQWTNGVLSLFESSEYLGVLATAAISKPVDCLISSKSALFRAIWRMLVSLFVPGIVIGILFSVWYIASRRNSNGWEYFVKRCALSVISVFYISYLGLTKMAVRAFYCIDVYDSVDYLESSKHKVWANDTSIRCYGKDHFGIISIAIFVLIVVTFCFPLVSSIVFIKGKESLECRDSWIFETAGFLFRAFKQRLAFWESVVMFRKACLSVIVVFSYPLGGDFQGVLASMLLLLSLHIHLTLRPYRKEFKSLNHFESCSLLMSSSTFILSLFFVIGRCSNSVRTFLAIIIIFGNIVFFFVLLLALFYSIMVHIRVILQCENIPLPVPPTWFNVLKVYIQSRIAKCCQK